MIMASEKPLPSLVDVLLQNKFNVNCVILMDENEVSTDAPSQLEKNITTIGAEKPLLLPKLSPEGLHFMIAANYIVTLEPGTRYLSYLPLAHIFERAAHDAVKWIGWKYGFTTNDVLSIVDDLSVLKPTFFTMVNRIVNRFFESINSKVKESSSPC